MRSKEVEEAINQLKEDVNIIIYGNKIFEDRTTCKKDDLKTVLSYIEQLEKMTPTPENEVPVEYQTVVFVDKRDAVMKSEIRDKIEKAKIKLANIGGEIQGKELVKISKTAYEQIRLEERIVILKMLLGESDEK